MLPLGQILQKFVIEYHCYADDTQIYISTSPNLSALMSSLNACLVESKAWMKHNYLKLNSSKTKILLIDTPNIKRCSKFTLTFDGSDVSPSTQVRNLRCSP